MPRRPWIPSAAIAPVLVAAALVTSCASGSEPVVQTLPPGTSATDGSDSSATTPSSGSAPSTVPGTATITSFDLRNQISCDGTVDVVTNVRYETTGADTVAFVVDGDQVPGSPATSGGFDIPISCDGSSHTVLLVAVDADGATTIDSRVVLTTTTPQGN